MEALPEEVLHEQTRANTFKISVTIINVNSLIHIGRRELKKIRFEFVNEYF